LPATLLFEEDILGRKSIAEIRKTEIIEAFLRIVAEKGLGKATVREIAAEAGCSHGMVRHYFGNKDSMVLEVLDYVIAEYKSNFQIRISQHKTAVDRLKFLMSWWVDRGKFDVDWGWTLMEIWVYSKDNPTVFKALQDYYDLARGTITGIIRDGIRSQEFRDVDPAITADLILADLDGLIRLWYVNPEKMALEQMAERATELFEEYLKHRI
jgi:AcrR family transcriptional regulator